MAPGLPDILCKGGCGLTVIEGEILFSKHPTKDHYKDGYCKECWKRLEEDIKNLGRLGQDPGVSPY